MRGQHILLFSRLMLAFLQNLEPEPTPIDSMITNQAVFQFHYLDKIHLFIIRRMARIFPHEGFAISVIASSEASARWRRVLKDQFDKAPELFVTSANAFFRSHQMRDQRTLDGRVWGIQGERGAYAFLR